MEKNRTMKIRTAVVDDEPLARERLLKLLRAEDSIEVVGEAGSGTAALELIRNERPELVFLDVQMPELDGFGVLAELSDAERPAIVFVTAYDKFALKAFDVHAVDYLLKPFDKERFHTGLARARQQLERRTTGELERRLIELVQ